VSQAAELRKLKEQEYVLLKQLEQRRKDFGIAYYRPHPKQDLFHRAGNFKRRAVFAGNRFGKSDCGAAEDVAQVRGEREWYPKTDPARTLGIPQRPQKVLVITTDWDKVDEIFTSERGANPGKLWKLFPRGFVKSKKRNHSGAIETIECENGSLLRFDTVKSFMANPQGTESSDWDVIHVDEPCPKEMYDSAARGLVDRGGKSYFTLTPLREPWIYDMFYGEQDAREMVSRGESQVHNVHFWSVNGSIWDNPYLSKEDAELYLSGLPDEERECRESGIPLAFAGLVYKDFNSRHIYYDLPLGWDDFNSPPKDYSIYYHVDPHAQTPIAVLFTAVSPLGRKFIFDEIWGRYDIPDVCDQIHAITAGYNVVRARIDPCAFIEDELTGTCWADDFAAKGVWLEKATKDKTRGIKRVIQEWKAPIPQWMVSPRCVRFLWEIKRWAWDKENKPVDKNDHMMENLYRSVLDEPIYVPKNDSDNQPIGDQDILGINLRDIEI
jgi:hypothetical protein